jgi:hypothetical protein
LLMPNLNPANAPTGYTGQAKKIWPTLQSELCKMFQAETVLVSPKPNTGRKCLQAQTSRWCSGTDWKQRQCHEEENQPTKDI